MPAQKPQNERPSRGCFHGNRNATPAKDEWTPLSSCEMVPCLPWMRPEATRLILQFYQGGKGDCSIACEFRSLFRKSLLKTPLFLTWLSLFLRILSASRRTDAFSKGTNFSIIKAKYPPASGGRRNIFFPFAVPVHRCVCFLLVHGIGRCFEAFNRNLRRTCQQRQAVVMQRASGYEQGERMRLWEYHARHQSTTINGMRSCKCSASLNERYTQHLPLLQEQSCAALQGSTVQVDFVAAAGIDVLAERLGECTFQRLLTNVKHK